MQVYIMDLMVICQNSDIFYRSAVLDSVAYSANTAELLLFGSTNIYWLNETLGKKTGAKCLVWLPFPVMAWKTAGRYQEDEKKSYFFLYLSFSSSSADYDIILKILWVCFFWYLVSSCGLKRSFTQKSFLALILSTPENNLVFLVVLLKWASLLLLLLCEVYLSKPSVQNSQCGYIPAI